MVQIEEEQLSSFEESKDTETSGRDNSSGKVEGLNGEEDSEKEETFEDALTEEQQLQKTIEEAEQRKIEGNKCFAKDAYDDAINLYSEALEILQDVAEANDLKATCHSNKSICFLKMGDNSKAIEESTAALELKPDYVKALLRRAQAQEKIDKLEEALADYKKVAELDPQNKVATANVYKLGPIVEERREKLKEEMMGKLKDLGNSILGNFGMSLDNFKAEKDPATGSYSISFKQ